MAAKKFYAVKRGKITGVFESWEDCKASVDGYPGAEYKSFSSKADAQAFLGFGECSAYPADAAENCREKASWWRMLMEAMTTR